MIASRDAGLRSSTRRQIRKSRSRPFLRMQTADEHRIVARRDVRFGDVIEMDDTVDRVQPLTRVSATDELPRVHFVRDHIPIGSEHRREHDEPLVRIERGEAQVEPACQRAAVVPFIAERRVRHEEIDAAYPARRVTLVAHPPREQQVGYVIARGIRDIESLVSEVRLSCLSPQLAVRFDEPEARDARLRDDPKTHAFHAIFAERTFAIRRRQDADVDSPRRPRSRELKRDLRAPAHRAGRRYHRRGDRDAPHRPACFGRGRNTSPAAKQHRTTSESTCSTAYAPAGL